MLYRGYSIEAPWPPNSGPLQVKRGGMVLKEFPYVTTDETVIAWINEYRKGQK